MKRMQILPLFKTVVSAFYPNVCAACGEIIPEGERFCDYCFCMLSRIDVDRLCTKCGVFKKHCICKNQVFHFDGITAPYCYSGVARRAMFKFKFRRKEYIGEFFARQMALCVKQSFKDIRFDNVVYVPAEKAKERRRGYNQSRVLAENLSEILKIPLLDDALLCHRKKHTQHSLELEYRFENVKGIYYTNKALNGKSFLLVDDIKTSGATLDSCAKALYAAGADRVYCVTGLAAKPKSKKKSKSKGNKNGN